VKGFDRFDHTAADGITHHVYRRGAGPAVIILHELVGITPPVLRFADRVIDRKFAAYLPALIEVSDGPTPIRMLRATVQVCLSAEFVKLARERTSPVVAWLRSLSKRIHDETHQPVGVVGLCLTGGFALAMAVEPHIQGPVIAHPSLPLGIGSKRKRDLGLSPSDLAAVTARTDLRLLGVRFSADLFAPCARFDRLDDEFGESFRRIEVPSGPGSPYGLGRGEHSVLTSSHLEDEHHPAHRALDAVLDDVLGFLDEEVRPPMSPLA
jgi:dienelactone hydrolase